MKFLLDEKQEAQIAEWYDTIVKPRILEQQKDLHPSLTLNGTEPYFGAIGGGLTYYFTPTGLGIVQKVHCGLTNLELDVTVYGEW